MHYSPALALGVLMLGLAACAMPGNMAATRGGGAGGLTAAPGCPVPPDAATQQAAMLDRVNARRRAAGLSPLGSSASLQRAAAIVACDNAQRGRMTHVTRQGVDLRGRLQAEGYGFRRAGEALAHGYRSADRLEVVWANSSYHRPTLMTPQARDAGIAVVLDSSGSQWWAMVSAQPR